MAFQNTDHNDIYTASPVVAGSARPTSFAGTLEQKPEEPKTPAARNGFNPAVNEDLDSSNNPNNVNSPKHPLYYLRLMALMGNVRDVAATQGVNPLTVNDAGFLNLIALGVQKLQEENILTESEATRFTNFVTRNSGMFRQAMIEDSQGADLANNPIRNGRGNIIETGFNSALALRVAGRDDAGLNYCARGVKNILRAMGMDCFEDNANNFDEQARRMGWVEVRFDRNNMPRIEGAIYFTDNDIGAGRGRARRDGGGSVFGHIDIGAVDNAGNFRWVSDTDRGRTGGSVWDNPTRIFLNPEIDGHAALIAQFNSPNRGMALDHNRI